MRELLFFDRIYFSCGKANAVQWIVTVDILFHSWSLFCNAWILYKVLEITLVFAPWSTLWIILFITAEFEWSCHWMLNFIGIVLLQIGQIVTILFCDSVKVSKQQDFLEEELCIMPELILMAFMNWMWYLLTWLIQGSKGGGRDCPSLELNLNIFTLLFDRLHRENVLILWQLFLLSREPVAKIDISSLQVRCGRCFTESRLKVPILSKQRKYSSPEWLSF